MPYVEISASEVESAIDELVPLGLEAVRITGGEPLIRKDDVFQLMDYCGTKGLNVSLETNAVLLTQSDIDRLSDLRFVEIGTSLDFPTAEAFNAFRRYPGAFEKVTSAIESLSKARPVTGAMAVFKENLPLMESTADLIIGIGGNARFLLCADVGRADENMRENLLSPRETLFFYSEVQRIAAKYPGRVNGITPWAFNRINTPLRVGMCEAEKNIGLLPDGSLSTCGIGITNSQAILGNIRTDSLLAVIEESPVLCQLRTVGRQAHRGVCSICLFSSVCGNLCPAHAFELYGSFQGPYPVCQQLYDAGLFPKEFLVDAKREEQTCVVD